jgi:hypothetical protein
MEIVVVALSCHSYMWIHGSCKQSQSMRKYDVWFCITVTKREHHWPWVDSTAAVQIYSVAQVS